MAFLTVEPGDEYVGGGHDSDGGEDATTAAAAAPPPRPGPPPGRPGPPPGRPGPPPAAGGAGPPPPRPGPPSGRKPSSGGGGGGDPLAGIAAAAAAGAAKLRSSSSPAKPSAAVLPPPKPSAAKPPPPPSSGKKPSFTPPLLRFHRLCCAVVRCCNGDVEVCVERFEQKRRTYRRGCRRSCAPTNTIVRQVCSCRPARDCWAAADGQVCVELPGPRRRFDSNCRRRRPRAVCIRTELDFSLGAGSHEPRRLHQVQAGSLRFASSSSRFSSKHLRLLHWWRQRRLAARQASCTQAGRFFWEHHQHDQCNQRHRVSVCCCTKPAKIV